MNTSRIFSMAFCAMAILATQNVTAEAGLFSPGKVFSEDCVDCCIESECCNDGCCEDKSCWLDGFKLFSRGENDCCIDDCCTNDYCCDDGCCGTGKGNLFGFVRPTNPCFCDFISPMTNPLFFEDPRNLSEIRFIYMNQRIPRGAFAGTLNVFAAQIRASLTERLSLVASQDGFVTSSNPLVRDGWADVAAGLKYNIVQDSCEGKLLSAGFAYTMPVGSTRTLQAQGDGEFHLYLAGAKRVGETGHFMSNAGFRLPANAAANSKMFYWSNHLDFEVADRFYLFGELNWFNWFQGGNNAALPTIEGGDLINLGSNDVAGNNIVTGAFGAKMRLANLSEIGVAYEIPVSSRNDLMDYRITMDYIIRY